MPDAPAFFWPALAGAIVVIHMSRPLFAQFNARYELRLCDAAVCVIALFAIGKLYA